MEDDKCMENGKCMSLSKRCSCSSGYFHDPCFIKWISKRHSLSCEVCNNKFNGAFIQLGNIRVYSSVSFKFFCLVTISLHLLSTVMWIYFKFFSDIVNCVHTKHPSNCGKYNYFRTFVLFTNIGFTVLIIMGISIFKEFPEYFGVFVDAPVCRILLTNPHNTFRQNIPEHPNLRGYNNSNESITIHNETRMIEVSQVVLHTAIFDSSSDTLVSVEDDPDTDEDNENDEDEDNENDEDEDDEEDENEDEDEDENEDNDENWTPGS